MKDNIKDVILEFTIIGLIIWGLNSFIEFERSRQIDYPLRAGIGEIARASQEEMNPQIDEAVVSKNDELAYPLSGEFSAYTSSLEECGKTDGITASGVKVQEKHTLACPNSFKFGARLMIEGLEGIYICEDRGGAIKGQKFDIYVPTKAEALSFGRQKLNYKIYE
jgi:3D (Asp-Asp-Asp) domain-containing protein